MSEEIKKPPYTTIIVAYNENFVIGNGVSVPWCIPEDLKFFKNTTMGHTCVMGRRTWDSIPSRFRPLFGRYNIIVTHRHRYFEFPRETSTKIAACDSIERAISLGKQEDPEGEVFLIGGGQIYAYALEHDLVDHVLASEIKGYLDVDGTTHFPNLKLLGWTSEVYKEFAEFTVMKYEKDHDRNNSNTRIAGESEKARRTVNEAI